MMMDDVDVRPAVAKFRCQCSADQTRQSPPSAVAPVTYAPTFGGETFIWSLKQSEFCGVTVGSTFTPAPFTIPR